MHHIVKGRGDVRGHPQNVRILCQRSHGVPSQHHVSGLLRADSSGDEGVEEEAKGGNPAIASDDEVGSVIQATSRSR
jgi:hypothetical protein